MAEPLKPDEMRYMDVGLAETCDCESCTPIKRMTATIELLARELSYSHRYLHSVCEDELRTAWGMAQWADSIIRDTEPIAQQWVDWANKGRESK